MSSTVTTEAPTAEIITVTNPRTGEVLYTVQGPTPDDVGKVYDMRRITSKAVRARS